VLEGGRPRGGEVTQECYLRNDSALWERNDNALVAEEVPAHQLPHDGLRQAVKWKRGGPPTSGVRKAADHSSAL
jgi:hypothetical protein